jgi:hypothetical protein
MALLFAIVTGRAKRDPSADLKDALRATGQPHITAMALEGDNVVQLAARARAEPCSDIVNRQASHYGRSDLAEISDGICDFRYFPA